MRVVVCQFEGIDTTPVLPLAAGVLVSAVKADPELAFCELDIAVVRGPLDEVVAGLGAPAVLGVSLYPWNAAYGLAVAEAAKRADPAVWVVVGGPSVPRRPAEAAAFLDAHPYVDVMVLSEGDDSFRGVLSARRTGASLDAIPGLAFRGEPHHVTAPPVRVANFSATASPYLDGTFDALFARHPGKFFMALCETNRGCPFSCTFCDWSLTKKIYDYPLERVLAEIDWVVAKGLKHMMLADANFGIRPRDSQIVGHVADLHRRVGAPTSFYWYLTKNNARRNLETIETLHDAGISTWVGLAVQDFDEEVLAAVKRDNIQTGESILLRRACAERGIPTFNELILGLPGQTYDSFTATVAEGMPGFPKHDFVLFFCRMIENAELGSPASRAEHGLVTVRSRWITSTPDFDPIVAEFQEIVVAHRTLPAADWRRAYRFAFFCAAAHNLRLLRVVLRYLADVLPLRDAVQRLVDALAVAPPGSVYADIHAILDRWADSLVSAGPLVLCLDDDTPEQRFYVDEAIARAAYARYDAFLAETAAALAPLDGPVLAEAFRYQGWIMPRPGVAEPSVGTFTHDWPAYVAAGGTGATLEARPTVAQFTPPPYAAIRPFGLFAGAHFGSIRARLDVGSVTAVDAPTRPSAAVPGWRVSPPASG
jgi:hypothetical protein